MKAGAPKFETATTQTIVVITEITGETYEDEFEIEAGATEEQIADAAADVFATHASYGWHRKGEMG